MYSQPDLIWTINNVQYNVPSIEYVLDVGHGNGKCALTLLGFNNGGFGVLLVFFAYYNNNIT